MRKKLTKVGTSQALIISKDLMGLMGLHEGAEVDIEMMGPVMIVKPTHLSPEDLAMTQLFARVVEEDREVLKRLAE